MLQFDETYDVLVAGAGVAGVAAAVAAARGSFWKMGSGWFW